MKAFLVTIKHSIWFILFFVWGIPLRYYRSKFRKIVYHTDSWPINIKPVFIKETKALFTTMYPDDTAYIRFRNFYRTYLLVYGVLFAIWYVFR
jgi:peroxiredoxin Q/BCP